MTSVTLSKQSADALAVLRRRAAVRMRFARRAWPSLRARLSAAAMRLLGAAIAASARSLLAAAPRLTVLAVALAICWTGVAMIWPDQDAPALAPSIDAADLSESTAALGEWLPIPRPMALYALESPDLPADGRRYEARRHSSGDGREDILSFNDFEDDAAPHLTLRLRRQDAEATAQPSLFVQAARQAADDGLAVERMARPSDIATKFGPVETADIHLTAGDSRRACIALRFALADGALAASGFACGGAAKPMDRAQLVCLIDRLTLLAANDERIKLAFARAELARGPHCGGSRNGASGRRAGWLDPAGQAPALKGLLIAQR